jgi:hypothetical protein
MNDELPGHSHVMCYINDTISLRQTQYFPKTFMQIMGIIISNVGFLTEVMMIVL